LRLAVQYWSLRITHWFNNQKVIHGQELEVKRNLEMCPDGVLPAR